MKRLIFILLGLVLGCAYGTQTPEPKIGDRNAKVTYQTAEYLTHQAWERSGYYRVGDEAISLPVLITIAGDRTACIVDGMTWGSWQERRVVKVFHKLALPQRPVMKKDREPQPNLICIHEPRPTKIRTKDGGFVRECVKCRDFLD